MSTRPKRCPIHQVELQCPACIGARGGAVSSPAKAEAARKNARRPRPGRHLSTFLDHAPESLRRQMRADAEAALRAHERRRQEKGE